MARIEEKLNKSGLKVFRIRCRISRNAPEYSTTWTAPEGWSDKVIQREVLKVAADFERRCHAGEVMTRTQMKAAKEAERKAQEEILTVSQYVDRVFMPQKKLTCTPNTIASFETNLRIHILPVIGDRKLQEVNAADLTALLANIQRNISTATAGKNFTILNLIFKSAYLMDMISHNPMDKVQRPRQNKDEKKTEGVEACSAEELTALLDFVGGEPLKWRVFIMILIYTGMRRGEACGLQWQDIDFDHQTITVRRSLNYLPAKGIFEGTPKSGKYRTVDAPSDLFDLLRKLRNEQSKTVLSKWIFTQDGTTEPMHPQSPQNYLKSVSAKTGIEHLHPHKLRHSFASLAIQSGADILSVSEILGHADTAITLRIYSHGSEQSRRRASSIFNNALNSVKQPPNAQEK